MEGKQRGEGPAPEKAKKKAEEKPVEQKKLIEKEHQQLGSVGFAMYKHYFQAAGGMGLLGLTVFFFAADTTCRSFADW